MTQYLIAVWDYEAEGEFELSFKQGDRIKLLEKHNDDWWEGELNDEIGFFPANRVCLETSEDLTHETESTAIKSSTSLKQLNEDKPPILPARPERVSNPLSIITPPVQGFTESPLPQGWEHAYDQDGTIYYFNESTGESRWDRPSLSATASQNETIPIIPQREESNSVDTLLQVLRPEELQKLEFDKLQPEWIRHKGYIQMKMISGKEDGGKLSSWKVYYAVLSNGFLLLYKEGHAKSKKSSRTHVPVGSFDLESCTIDPAGKQDTKRKHVFIISTPKKVKLYVQTTSDKEFSAWLDAIMRELIARKEGQNNDTEIMRLLKSLTIDENQMKVNRKMTQEHAEDRKSLGHWFSSKPNSSGGSNSYHESSNNSNHITQKMELKYQYAQSQPSNENDIFGGYLHLEENGDIPYVVSLCIREVEARGLKSVGIYRLSGPASTIQKYKASFNKREHVTFKEEHDINAVTGLLKLYFRELRQPLMTFEYYDWFIDAAKISDYEERMYQIKSIIHSLPKANYIVLERLMRHLHLVASYSEINKMEASNLALIFSVGLLRTSQEDNLSSIMMSDLRSKIIEAIIQQVDWFFEEDNEEEKAIDAHVQSHMAESISATYIDDYTNINHHEHIHEGHSKTERS
ncbi:MAG: hypothetical protein EXX96DRAFT_44094 [Benjaminiella poitrasii]|nr:MAG: hypothetical protein EXX96DRAFT_44094 [Benjaminiella poitrasii]